MKYAHVNENNKLLGWYDDKIHTEIPTPNIEVTQEQWQNAIDNNHNKINNDGSTEYFDFRTEEEILQQENDTKLQEAYKYLSDTDYCFTVDKYAQLTEDRKIELETKRQEARDLINTLEASNEQ